MDCSGKTVKVMSVTNATVFSCRGFPIEDSESDLMSASMAKLEDLHNESHIFSYKLCSISLFSFVFSFFLITRYCIHQGFPGSSVVKNL